MNSPAERAIEAARVLRLHIGPGHRCSSECGAIKGVVDSVSAYDASAGSSLEKEKDPGENEIADRNIQEASKLYEQGWEAGKRWAQDPQAVSDLRGADEVGKSAEDLHGQACGGGSGVVKPAPQDDPVWKALTRLRCDSWRFVAKGQPLSTEGPRADAILVERELLRLRARLEELEKGKV